MNYAGIKKFMIFYESLHWLWTGHAVVELVGVKVEVGLRTHDVLLAK